MNTCRTAFVDKSVFSVRIVVCDHYLTKPIPGIDVTYSEFRGSDVKQVPVLRIFGAASDGHKTCLHVHGVFPYFYLPCPSPNPRPEFLYQIAASLDKALNIALKQATSSNQHVYKITLVKGLPFYGFHDKEHLYLKVFLYSPGLIKQAVELCSNGAILGQPLQPHESHLNFTLQFFIDFNLFGMSNIDLQNVFFRKQHFSQSSNDVQSPQEFNLKSESICYYEADCVASQIINRQRVGKGDGIENPGLEEVWNQEMERRKQLNISTGLKSLSQVRIKAEETESHYKYEKLFLMKMSNVINKPVPVEANDQKELVHYPAESMEGSQLSNAVDVTVHLSDDNREMISQSKEFTCEDLNDTLVDENKAYNSSLSLHFSQILLDNDDMDLIDMLQDMDDKIIEEDSVIATPLSEDHDSDDAEYSQVFNDDTIVINKEHSTDDDNENLQSWNDTFWEEANIPQLDGTCDDDHVKKVRKRKMRPLKLGLSRPRSKKFNVTINNKSDTSDTDEINTSRETIEIDSLLMKTMKVIPVSFNSSHELEDDLTNNTDLNSATDVSEKVHENKASENYDLIKKFEPSAGPSNLNKTGNTHEIATKIDLNNFIESSPEESDLDIMSFYNTSKIFDISWDNLDESRKEEQNTIRDKENKREVIGDTQKRIETVCLTPKIRPPSRIHVEANLDKYKIPKVKNLKPYYSNPKDVGDKVELGQIILKLQSHSARDQKHFENFKDITSLEDWRHLLFMQRNELIDDESAKIDNLRNLLASNRLVILKPLKNPPTTKEMLVSLEKQLGNPLDNNTSYNNIDNEIIDNKEDLDNSQAIGLYEDEINKSISLESVDKDKTSLDNSFQVTMQPDGSFLCFNTIGSGKESSSLESPAVEANLLTIMLIEVLTSVRSNFHPNPALDPIQAVFINLTNDYPKNHLLFKSITEIVVVDATASQKLLDRCVFDINITYVQNENGMFDKIIEFVKANDPDILCGYEIEKGSWGYILERSQTLGLEMVAEISRITDKYRQKRWRSDDNDFEGRILGRIIFNVWRLLRYELALSSYSFENCMYEVLKERVPTYSFAQLYEWWSDESRILRWIPVEYFLTRLSGTLRILEKLDIINRTAELARLFGLQWWEVLSRGSQFRVESLMLRAARPLNLIALSPTVKQRAAMKAPEILPLIFEPESRFYADPVIVLDFQSLYPSMMIAYNYCFSTCIGRVQNINGESNYEFGAWRLRIPKAKLEALVNNDLVHWSPVGVGYVKPSVRRGVLPALLRRILAARQAVKKNMKLQTDEAIKKAMHSRQLGLKLIANVTYGYTAANFSGRMPCVEVGDSVVAKGRETLERAIKLVKNNKQWNVKVVYGDTDSMFVLVPGGTRADAFNIGQQIADAVTADNPTPVALKLEKVYQPCILQTKKRYVGYMYESPTQEKPVYEAKGIETVRRDGCPAGVKLLQRSLVELFESGDMSRVKRLVAATLARLADGTLPLPELFFTREYHGPNGYRPGAAAPPNEIAKRICMVDGRACPARGWRVSWLVCAGAPGTALVRLARSPAELLACPRPPHAHYYAARVLLPPLHRCLSLMGVDVFKWWRELGVIRGESSTNAGSGGGGIARYLCVTRCVRCGVRASRPLCAACAASHPRRSAAALTLACKLHHAQLSLKNAQQICQSCCGHDQHGNCENTECPILWSRHSEQNQNIQLSEILTQLQE